MDNKNNLLGFNIWNNGRINSQSNLGYGLGKMRNTVGSTTRIHRHCSRYSSDPLNCVLGSIMNNSVSPPTNSTPNVPATPTPNPPVNPPANPEDNVNYVVFTDVGPATWTAPDGVTSVQYLVVGGGGGGGATYSKINVLGDVLVTDTPQANTHWINSVHLTNGRYSGRLYYHFNSGQNSTSFTDPIRLTASDPHTPTGVVYDYNKWYDTEVVYFLTGGLVTTSNWVPPYRVNSTQSNNVSGGSGGGAGGQVRSLTGTNKYTVIPGTIYQINVGGGGQGGVGGSNSEANGSAGSDSSFDTITSLGGSGGSYSRKLTLNQDTNKNGTGGVGGQGNGNLVGGGGGGKNMYDNYGRYNSGGTGSTGSYINFDGNGNIIYGAGGNGGVPNTVATGTTSDNTGRGGNGTGATLNSYANGIDGGSGIVIIKYYT
jgi:hypothetical protein